MSEIGEQDDWKKPRQYSESREHPARVYMIRILSIQKDEASHLTGSAGGVDKHLQGCGECQDDDSHNTQVVYIRFRFENNKKILRRVHGEISHPETNIFDCPLLLFDASENRRHLYKTEATIISRSQNPSQTSPRNFSGIIRDHRLLRSSQVLPSRLVSPKQLETICFIDGARRTIIHISCEELDFIFQLHSAFDDGSK